MTEEMLIALMEYATAAARHEIAEYHDRAWAVGDRLEKATEKLWELYESERT